MQLLKTRPNVDPKRIGLYGPSNGGWVVEYAAARSNDVAFIIVVSGGGIPNWESEVYRVEAQTRAADFSADEIREAVSFMRQKFEVARTGEGWEQLQASIHKSRKTKWIVFVNVPRSLDRLQEAWNGQFGYDPYSDLSKLKTPVLAIFGQIDTETPAKQIAARTEEALKKAANNHYTIRVFPRATDGIMIFPEAGKPWHFFGFAKGYLDLISRWVLRQARLKARVKNGEGLDFISLLRNTRRITSRWTATLPSHRQSVMVRPDLLPELSAAPAFLLCGRSKGVTQ